METTKWRLEAGGSRRRSTLVVSMCGVMAGMYVLAVIIPLTRTFFELSAPNLAMILTALLASAISVAALNLCGFSLRLIGPSRGPEGPAGG